MLFIWETFVQNVDPFLKVLHVPSTERGLRAKKFSMRDMDPSTRALMSCISYAAVTTLTEEEVGFFPREECAGMTANLA